MARVTYTYGATEADERKRLITNWRQQRQQQRERRNQQLLVAKAAKDTARIIYLERLWAKQDARIDWRKMSWEYICQSCNHPFTTPRQLDPRTRHVWCYICKKFYADKQQREWQQRDYQRRRDAQLDHSREQRQHRNWEKLENLKPKPAPRKPATPPREPNVVWQPS
jgi:hypothetical protein